MTDNTKTKEQQNRDNNIDKLLRHFNEKDIPDKIIHTINELYPVTKVMNFLRTEQLETGMFIKAVSLDLKRIYATSIILKIESTSSHKIGKLNLLNIGYKTYWGINPNKYYIFQAEEGALKTYEFMKEIKNKKNKKLIK
jgi:hypothetical protein